MERVLAQSAHTGSAAVVNHRVYSAFGTLESQSNEAVECLFGYTGRPYDKLNKLQNNGHRWYDPGTGRWLSEDPLGFGGGDVNLSRYCGNSPTNYIDPTGLTETATFSLTASTASAVAASPVIASAPTSDSSTRGNAGGSVAVEQAYGSGGFAVSTGGSATGRQVWQRAASRAAEEHHEVGDTMVWDGNKFVWRRFPDGTEGWTPAGSTVSGDANNYSINNPNGTVCNTGKQNTNLQSGNGYGYYFHNPSKMDTDLYVLWIVCWSTSAVAGGTLAGAGVGAGIGALGAASGASATATGIAGGLGGGLAGTTVGGAIGSIGGPISETIGAYGGGFGGGWAGGAAAARAIPRPPDPPFPENTGPFPENGGTDPIGGGWSRPGPDGPIRGPSTDPFPLEGGELPYPNQPPPGWNGPVYPDTPVEDAIPWYRPPWTDGEVPPFSNS